jgi:hypothetical protein
MVGNDFNDGGIPNTLERGKGMKGKGGGRGEERKMEEQIANEGRKKKEETGRGRRWEGQWGKEKEGKEMQKEISEGRKRKEKGVGKGSRRRQEEKEF